MTEMVSQPMPRMPSNLENRNAMPGSLVASANTWSLISRPAHVTVSWERNPESDPLPYWMANGSPRALYVLESPDLYFWCKSHGIWRNEHLALGIHRLLLPVSKTTRKDWGGVPMDTTP